MRNRPLALMLLLLLHVFNRLAKRCSLLPVTHKDQLQRAQVIARRSRCLPHRCPQLRRSRKRGRRLVRRIRFELTRLRRRRGRHTREVKVPKIHRCFLNCRPTQSSLRKIPFFRAPKALRAPLFRKQAHQLLARISLHHHRHFPDMHQLRPRPSTVGAVVVRLQRVPGILPQPVMRKYLSRLFPHHDVRRRQLPR